MISKWIILLLLAYPLYAAEVSYRFSATAVGNINVECSKVSASVQGSKLIAAVELKSCDSRNDGRNKHMWEDLDVEHYPVARLEALLSDKSFSGELEIHGHKKKVSGSKDGNVLKFDINMSDFGVPQRKQLFGTVTVHDKVSITGKF